MGREGTAEEYSGESQIKPEYPARYALLYKTAISYLPKPEDCSTVVDLGCGTGNLATVFLEPGYTKYLGIDFSPPTIQYARERVPGVPFIVGDLRDKEIQTIFPWHRIFIALETLEHIENDLDIIRSIPCGSLVIFSVPNFDGPFHVRHFKSMSEVFERYATLLDFKENKVIICPQFLQGRYFLFKCIRNLNEGESNGRTDNI